MVDRALAGFSCDSYCCASIIYNAAPRLHTPVAQAVTVQTSSIIFKSIQQQSMRGTHAPHKLFIMTSLQSSKHLD